MKFIYGFIVVLVLSLSTVADGGPLPMLPPGCHFGPCPGGVCCPQR